MVNKVVAVASKAAGKNVNARVAVASKVAAAVNKAAAARVVVNRAANKADANKTARARREQIVPAFFINSLRSAPRNPRTI